MFGGTPLILCALLATPPSGGSSAQQQSGTQQPGSAGTSATNTAAAGQLHPPLQLIDQGTADRGGLMTSFRLMPLDMRLPTGFTDVYRVPGSDDKMMRGNGALFAVFPKSVYRRTAIGMIPIAPAGVVYHIGMPGGMVFPGSTLGNEMPPSDPRIATRVDRRVRLTPIDQAKPLQIGVSNSDRAGSEAETPADPMPPISDAPRVPPADPASAPAKLDLSDLRLGPARVVRE